LDRGSTGSSDGTDGAVVEFPELLYRLLAQLLTDAPAAPDRSAANTVL